MAKFTCHFSRPALAHRFCAIAASPIARQLILSRIFTVDQKAVYLYRPARYSILCLSNPNVHERAKDVPSRDSILAVRYSGVCFLRSKIYNVSKIPRGRDIRPEEPPEYTPLIPALIYSFHILSLSCTHTNQHDFHRNQHPHLALDRQPPPQNW